MLSPGNPSRAACASNLRQLNIALAVYVGEHDGLYPPYNKTAAWPAQLQSYYQSFGVLTCTTDDPQPPPVDPADADAAPRSYVMNLFGDHFSAVLSPADFRSFTKGTSSRSLAEGDVSTPDAMILFGEKATGRPEFHVDLNNVTLSSVVDVTAQNRHLRSANAPKSGGSNHAYADGSVRYSLYGRSLCPINEWAITDAGRTNLAICIYK